MLFNLIMSWILGSAFLSIVLFTSKSAYLSGDEAGTRSEWEYYFIKLLSVVMLFACISAGLWSYGEMQRQQRIELGIQEMKQFDKDLRDPHKRQQLLEKMKKELNK